MKIRTRLTLFFIIVFSVVLVLYSLIFAGGFRVIFNSMIDKQHQFIINTFKEIIEKNSEKEIIDIISGKKVFPEFKQAEYSPVDFLWTTLYDNNKNIIVKSNLAKNYPISFNESYIKKKHFIYKVNIHSNNTSFYNDTPIFRITVESILINNRQYYIAVGNSITNEFKLLETLKNYVLISSLILLVIIFVIGIFYSKITLKPITDITHELNKISSEDLSNRLRVVNEYDEIGILTKTINNLFDRIESAFIMEKQFISDVSHEFKTPISILRLSLEEILNNPGLCDNDIDRLGGLLETLYSMDFLVEKLLYLSRLEKNMSPFNPEEIDLNEVINKVYDNLKLIADNKNLEFKINLNNNLKIHADKDLIYMALYNIAENAIKYTNKGSVIIDARTNNNNIEILVEDTGEGIPEDKIAHIYDRFYRVDFSRNKNEGFGIGLSIAKRIIDLHNGKVSVKSELGFGTTFCIDFPIM